ncbi:50S ribosomal protein L4 [Candidatus Gribaldobacteria bacterium]|nr:50S ribosomal protein L4 [Candidatus Gribaldobacteria bacterium]
MQVKIYNQKGEEAGKAILSKDVFGLDINNDLIHQVAISQRANQRQNNAQAKDRSEVRGGGKKPWRQKGTGRARHGSRRSPIWAGGGITFGPRNQRNYQGVVPKKMRQKALLMVLSAKAKENFLLIIDEWPLLAEAKTKFIAQLLSLLPCKNKSCLLISEEHDRNLFLASRNLSNVGLRAIKDINVLDLLNYQYVLTTKKALKFLEKENVKK